MSTHGFESRAQVRRAVRAALLLAPAFAAAPFALAQDRAASAAALEEVVVTARKAEEKLTAVPLAIAAYSSADLAKRKAVPPKPVDDATFARRAHLDLVGLLPEPEALAKFLADKSTDKRAALVRSLITIDSSHLGLTTLERTSASVPNWKMTYGSLLPFRSLAFSPLAEWSLTES